MQDHKKMLLQSERKDLRFKIKDKQRKMKNLIWREEEGE